MERNIFLHLDNDQVGKFATKQIIQLLNNYNVYDYTPRKYKDVNEILISNIKLVRNSLKDCNMICNMR